MSDDFESEARERARQMKIARADQKVVDAALAAYWSVGAGDEIADAAQHRRDGSRCAQTLRHLDVVIAWLEEKRRALRKPLAPGSAKILQKSCPALSRKYPGTCAEDVIGDLYDVGEALELASAVESKDDLKLRRMIKLAEKRSF